MSYWDELYDPQPGALSTQPPPSPVYGPGALAQGPVGALSGSAMAQPVAMPKPKWTDYLGDVALPLLATIATGGFGAPAAFAYGINAAMSRKRLSEDPLAQAQYGAETAQAQYIANNPGIAVPGRMNIPAEIQIDRYMQEDPGYADRLRIRRQAGGVVQRHRDAQGNEWGVMADGSQIYLGPSMQSDEGYRREVAQAGRMEGAKTAAQIAAQTNPEAVAAQAEAGATIGGAKAGAEKAATDKVGTLNLMAESIGQQQSMLAVVDDLIAAVENGPETGPVAEWQALLDPQLQALQSVVNDQVLAIYTKARASGMTGQMSNKEMDLIRSIGARLTNYRAANLKILRAQRESLMRNIQAGRKSYTDLQGATVRPLPDEYRGQRPPLTSFEGK